MRASKFPDLVVHALRIEQRPDAPLFAFGINGRLIQQFATVNPAHRDGKGVLEGYQRDQVRSHIKQIRDYLNSDGAMLPNAVVLAFDTSVKFEPFDGVVLNEWGTPGILHIPVPAPGEPKSAFIVDGQQRISALSELPPNREFPVVVVGFSTDSIQLQREQFLLVNRTKPLPRDLLNELLPGVETALPAAWRMRQTSSRVLNYLRFEPSSPFYGRIRGIGSLGVEATISQAAVLAVIEGSIRSKGILEQFYSIDAEDYQIELMGMTVSTYFGAVATVWPKDWASTAWSSRLVHGVGIVSMGRVMEYAMGDIDSEEDGAASEVAKRLRRMKPYCAWSSGSWPKLRCKWNELQNTSQDKRRLSDYLIKVYLRENLGR